jgi:hypothetical protein
MVHKTAHDERYTFTATVEGTTLTIINSTKTEWNGNYTLAEED